MNVITLVRSQEVAIRRLKTSSICHGYREIAVCRFDIKVVIVFVARGNPVLCPVVEIHCLLDIVDDVPRDLDESATLVQIYPAGPTYAVMYEVTANDGTWHVG